MDDSAHFIKVRSDEELHVIAKTEHVTSLVESNRRLRDALQEEERAIKTLTKWLVGFTAALVFFTVVLVTLEIFKDFPEVRSALLGVLQKLVAVIQQLLSTMKH